MRTVNVGSPRPRASSSDDITIAVPDKDDKQSTTASTSASRSSRQSVFNAFNLQQSEEVGTPSLVEQTSSGGASSEEEPRACYV